MEYPQRIEVDGEVFVVTDDDGQPHVAHFSWISGPNPGYGFTSGRFATSGGVPPPLAEHDLEEAARHFLAQVDPATGYVE